jgi:hypothetical protein
MGWLPRGGGGRVRGFREAESEHSPLAARAEGARIPRSAIRAPVRREVAESWRAESWTVSSAQTQPNFRRGNVRKVCVAPAVCEGESVLMSQVDGMLKFLNLGWSSPKWTKVQSTAPWPQCFKPDPDRVLGHRVMTPRKWLTFYPCTSTVDATKSKKWAWHSAYTTDNQCRNSQFETARNSCYVGQSSPRWTKVLSTAPWPQCFKPDPDRVSGYRIMTPRKW